MRADRNAPVLGAGEVETAADPDTVWVVLADIQGWPSWNPDITDAMLRGHPCLPAPPQRAASRPHDRLHRGVLGRPQVAPGKWGCSGSYRNAGGEGTLVEFGNGRGQMTLHRC